MTARQRPLTPEERRTLEAYEFADSMRGLFAAYGFGSLMLVAVLLSVISFLWNPLSSLVELPRRSDVKWWLLIACSLIVPFCLIPSFSREYQQAKSSDRLGRKVEADLLDGVAAIEVLDVTEAYEIEEFEDEGAGFLLSLRDGRVLCVIGQDLYPYSVSAESDGSEFSDMIFPNTKIERTFAPHSGLVFSTRGLEDYLKPKAILRWPDQGPASNEFSGPYPGQFSDGPVDDVISRAGFSRVPL
jgi:hypothetical protein